MLRHDNGSLSRLPPSAPSRVTREAREAREERKAREARLAASSSSSLSSTFSLMSFGNDQPLQQPASGAGAGATPPPRGDRKRQGPGASNALGMNPLASLSQVSLHAPDNSLPAISTTIATSTRRQDRERERDHLRGDFAVSGASRGRQDDLATVLDAAPSGRLTRPPRATRHNEDGSTTTVSRGDRSNGSGQSSFGDLVNSSSAPAPSTRAKSHRRGEQQQQQQQQSQSQQQQPHQHPDRPTLTLSTTEDDESSYFGDILDKYCNSDDELSPTSVTSPTSPYVSTGGWQNYQPQPPTPPPKSSNVFFAKSNASGGNINSNNDRIATNGTSKDGFASRERERERERDRVRPELSPPSRPPRHQNGLNHHDASPVSPPSSLASSTSSPSLAASAKFNMYLHSSNSRDTLNKPHTPSPRSSVQGSGSNGLYAATNSNSNSSNGNNNSSNWRSPLVEDRHQQHQHLQQYSTDSSPGMSSTSSFESPRLDSPHKDNGRRAQNGSGSSNGSSSGGRYDTPSQQSQPQPLHSFSSVVDATMRRHHQESSSSLHDKSASLARSQSSSNASPHRQQDRHQDRHRHTHTPGGSTANSRLSSGVGGLDPSLDIYGGANLPADQPTPHNMPPMAFPPRQSSTTLATTSTATAASSSSASSSSSLAYKSASRHSTDPHSHKAASGGYNNSSPYSGQSHGLTYDPHHQHQSQQQQQPHHHQRTMSPTSQNQTPTDYLGTFDMDREQAFGYNNPSTAGSSLTLNGYGNSANGFSTYNNGSSTSLGINPKTGLKSTMVKTPIARARAKMNSEPRKVNFGDMITIISVERMETPPPPPLNKKKRKPTKKNGLGSKKDSRPPPSQDPEYDSDYYEQPYTPTPAEVVVTKAPWIDNPNYDEEKQYSKFYYEEDPDGYEYNDEAPYHSDLRLGPEDDDEDDEDDEDEDDEDDDPNAELYDPEKERQLVMQKLGHGIAGGGGAHSEGKKKGLFKFKKAVNRLFLN